LGRQTVTCGACERQGICCESHGTWEQLLQRGWSRVEEDEDGETWFCDVHHPVGQEA
jgi:hypothetical protein